MKIDQEFGVDVPVERAWQALTDLEGLAPCMPGAELTGVDGDTYRGRVKVKVGPVISQFTGTARFVKLDDATHIAVISAAGKDTRGAGNASATIHARLRADGVGTLVTVSTDLNISGKLAQFGSGMIKEISEKLFAQFVENVETQLLAPEKTPVPEPDEAPQAVAEPLVAVQLPQGGDGGQAAGPDAVGRQVRVPAADPGPCRGRGGRRRRGSPAGPVTRAGQLLPAVDRAAFAVAFAARLRERGVAVGLTATQDFVRALVAVPPVSRTALYWSARVTLVRRRPDLPRFDEEFDAVFGDALLSVDPHARRTSDRPAPPGGSARAAAVEPYDVSHGAGDRRGLPWTTLAPVVAQADHRDDVALSMPERLPSDLAGTLDTPFEQLGVREAQLLGRWLERALREWPVRRSRRYAVRPGGPRIAIRETAARRGAPVGSGPPGAYGAGGPAAPGGGAVRREPVDAGAGDGLPASDASTRADHPRRGLRLRDLADPAHHGPRPPFAAGGAGRGHGAGRRPVRRNADRAQPVDAAPLAPRRHAARRGRPDRFGRLGR